MKLSSIAKDPSLKNIGKPGYKYSLNFKDNSKKVETFGHMSTVFELVKGLLERKLMTADELMQLKAISGYHFMIEVTDYKDDDAIKAELVNVKWNARYSLSDKYRIKFDNKEYILVREWTAQRIDKLIKLVENFCKVSRISGPELS